MSRFRQRWIDPSDHRIGPSRAAEPRGRGTAVPRSQSTMAAYWHFVIMVVGGIETMWLSHCHTRGLLKWEPIWWVAISGNGRDSDLANNLVWGGARRRRVHAGRKRTTPAASSSAGWSLCAGSSTSSTSPCPKRSGSSRSSQTESTSTGCASAAGWPPGIPHFGPILDHRPHPPPTSNPSILAPLPLHPSTAATAATPCAAPCSSSSSSR